MRQVGTRIGPIRAQDRSMGEISAETATFLRELAADIPLLPKTRQVPTGLANRLEAQSNREVNLWQCCHKIDEKSSEIVPLGAPF